MPEKKKRWWEDLRFTGHVFAGWLVVGWFYGVAIFVGLMPK